MVAEEFAATVQQGFVLRMGRVQRAFDQGGLCDRRGCHVEIHGHEIHGGERHAGVQKRIHGLHSLYCKTFHVGWKRQADDQIVAGIVFSFVFRFFIG